ncbi:DMT family transporter [Oceaniglobus ichthyenteri]|uniref:DMT family transporter n=1 Tax=Oceaniglobus ichthyenteri TaxID=2136177 RepID=UPI000D34BFE3|nr:DMT family transporter [Oceaniglobus ichthyenteri]
MTPRAPNPPMAVALMIFATAFIAATTVLAKALGTESLSAPLHPLQISHGRFMFAFLGICTMAAVLRPPVRTANLPLHAVRSLFGWGGVTLMFASVAFIPLSDATAISFLNPVFAMVLAIPLLGERVGPVRWSAAALALVGAVILLRPGSGVIQPGALLALGAAAIMGVEIILIKRLSGRERPLQILLINNAIGFCIASLAVVWVWAPPTAPQWAALVAIGLLMACAQTFFINAMARAEASFVAPFSYGTLLFATLYDFALFDVVPDGISTLGAMVIVSGGVVLAARDRRRAAVLPK